MDVLSWVVGFLAGAFLGIAFTLNFRKRSDYTVEDAIQLLKDKGYYTNINVLPKKGYK